MIYEPQEDSFLLLEQVKKFSKGKVLDIGTGSGIQAQGAAERKEVEGVLAVDIQRSVISHCKKTIKHPKIAFKVSDLFSAVKGSFDTIIFNPPYLPDDPSARDIALDGGKKGYEVLERFLRQAFSFLKDEGMILIVFSSMTNKNRVDKMIADENFSFVELSRQHIPFEDLYVYMLKKTLVLPRIKGLSDIKRLAKGHRGLLFTCRYKNKPCVLKVKRPDSEASGRMLNEALWLKRLNKEGIGPKLYLSGPEWFIYEYIPGIFLPEYVIKGNRPAIRKVLAEVFSQCFVMDRLGVDKEEMHRPFKHVIVGKKIVLVDFERAHNTDKPKNVTQFCQYIISEKFGSLLRKKDFKIDRKAVISLAKEYKKHMSKRMLCSIVRELR